MMLYGRFEHNMDAKGRVFVPVKLREKLGETFIAACVLDRCVSLYSMEEWNSLLEKLASGPMAETRKLLRRVTESAEDVTPDAQGRILLNKNLIAHASLEKPALIIGAGRRAEIWNPAVYEAEMADMTDEKLEEYCDVFIERNKYFAQKFKELGILSYDTSANRMEVLEKILFDIERLC